MKRYELAASIARSSSSESTTKIIPAAFVRSTSTSTSFNDLDLDYAEELYHRSVVRGGSPTAAAASAAAAYRRLERNRGSAVGTFLRSLLSIITFPSILPTCRWLGAPNQLSVTPALGRKVTGTLFGHRRGAVSFAVQLDPRSVPVFLIEFAVSTAALVKEMSAGLLRIALECEKPAARPRRGAARLFGEPVWNMYCNGRQCGHAQVRECNEADWHVLSTVQSVSVGAGVIPAVDDGRKGGELLYMRARFERVVGNRDSEAFYMLNPDGNGGPELGIFLLRI
ncbi:protein MIZU-KUSSEI 1-like [Salvia miltiorrhiza]|uniref:protein MIZU-KUSSEI 1-like n=1 Tax=Salvia miltiorrhiza TaxID=226208 RepID=UPI0025AD8804|nr:protein MIZU-KUSSEI 1-like [Salvia miltiorrhiza]